MNMQKTIRFGVLSALLVSGGLLAACDSKPASSPVAAKPALEKYQSVAELQGLVRDDNGPVKTGIVKALSEKGDLLASVALEDSPRYNLELPAGTALPVILAYYPSIDAGDDQRMIAVAVHANASKYDINPLSTRIAKQAKAMGGYTHSNLVRAAEETGTVPADNKTTAGFRGDPTTQYGGWH